MQATSPELSLTKKGRPLTSFRTIDEPPGLPSEPERYCSTVTRVHTAWRPLRGASTSPFSLGTIFPLISTGPPIAWLMGDVAIARMRLRRATFLRFESTRIMPTKTRPAPRNRRKPCIVVPAWDRPPNRLPARIGVYRQAHAHPCATLSTTMASRDPKERADRGAGRREPAWEPSGRTTSHARRTGYGQASGDH